MFSSIVFHCVDTSKTRLVCGKLEEIGDDDVCGHADASASGSLRIPATPRAEKKAVPVVVEEDKEEEEETEEVAAAAEGSTTRGHAKATTTSTKKTTEGGKAEKAAAGSTEKAASATSSGKEKTKMKATKAAPADRTTEARMFTSTQYAATGGRPTGKPAERVPNPNTLAWVPDAV
jgi:hypothetical protein